MAPDSRLDNLGFILTRSRIFELTIQLFATRLFAIHLNADMNFRTQDSIIRVSIIINQLFPIYFKVNRDHAAAVQQAGGRSRYRVIVEPLSWMVSLINWQRVLGQLSEIREPWRVLLNYTTDITLFYEMDTYSINKFRRPSAVYASRTNSGQYAGGDRI